MPNIKYSPEQINTCFELFEEWKNVTIVAKKIAELYNFEYTDSLRRAVSKIINRDKEIVEEDDFFEISKTKEFDKTKNVFFISWVQSDTKVNESMLSNMKAYAEYHNATIHLIAGRYKNPNSIEASNILKDKEQNKYTWDSLAIPYLDSNRHNIHENLCVLSDVKIQPTASTPLTSLNGLTGKESCVVGHPRQHLKYLPVLDGYPKKIICTTGALTHPNYTDTKVGKTSEFHHTYGFVIIELDDNDFIVRPVSCLEDGSFCDLIWEVKNGVVSDNQNKGKAIVWGDLHAGKHNEALVDLSVKMTNKLIDEDKKVYLHDAFDASSISHHDLKDPFILAEKEGFTLENELNYLSTWLSNYNQKFGFNFYIVRSNHDEHLDKWLKDTDWRKSPNREFYLRLANLVMLNPRTSALQLAVQSYFETDNVYFLNENQSHSIADVELSIHGHIGSGGSRGTAIQFKNLNTKAIVGHSHSPCIMDGLTVVGTLTDYRIGYNRGLNSWGWANCVIHSNGKRQLIMINNNYKYTTLI